MTANRDQNDNKPTLLALCQLQNDLKPVKQMKPLKAHLPLATYKEKRIATAAINTSSTIKDLEQRLVNLMVAKRKHASHDVRAIEPGHLNHEIKRIKTYIRDCRLRLANYQQGKSCRHREEYHDALFRLKDLPTNDHAIFVKELFRHESSQWDQFQAWEQRLDEYYHKASLDIKRDYYKKSFIMETKYGKQYPEARLKYYHRLCYVTKELGNHREVELIAKDGKWLIRHLQNVAKRLERERSMNIYLKPALDETEPRDDTACRRWGEKVYTRINLDELQGNRPILELMDFFGCQLREGKDDEGERDFLIRLAKECSAYCQKLFTKATLHDNDPAPKL